MWYICLLQKFFSDHSQAALVKLQVVTLAAKLFVLSPNNQTLALLAQYVFSLARYDANYDVRDRAKMISSLLAGISPNLLNPTQEERSGVVLRREQVRLVLFEGKSGVIEDELDHAGKSFSAIESQSILNSVATDDEKALLGSLNIVLGKPMQMDSLLPDWLEKGVESSLRESEDDKPATPVPTAISSSAGPRTKTMASPVVLTPTVGSRPDSRQESNKGIFAQDLDSFYADAVSSGEESEEEDEEEEEREEGEEEGEGNDDEKGAESDGDGDEDGEDESEEGDDGDGSQANDVNSTISR